MTYKVAISRTASRQLANELPLGVADAVLALIRGDLAENPQRVGKPLGGQLSGQWSARRGAYRILYKILEDTAVVQILNIGHRADIYRP